MSSQPSISIPQAISQHHHGRGDYIEVAAADIVAVVDDLYTNHRLELKLIDATDERQHNGGYRIWYVFGSPTTHSFTVVYIWIKAGTSYPSVTGVLHQAGMYERKIADLFGLIAEGNPDPRRTLMHENWPQGMHPLRKDFAQGTRPNVANEHYHFQRVQGEGIYEIPVGPIHAGIIEPGHFRFSVAGEEIVLLEPRLGYVHKGSEKLFEQFDRAHQLRLAEKISGDSSLSHCLGFSIAVEELGGITVPERAQYLRTIYAELERISNHFGDIGAIMLDTGFNFGGSQGPRLRETMLRLCEQMTGSRFLRGVCTIGGVTTDISPQTRTELTKQLSVISHDFSQVIEIAEGTVTLLNRLKGTGALPQDVAIDHGIMGVVGRAVGLDHDSRRDYPYASYNSLGFTNPAHEDTGDVYARFQIRIQEVYASIQLIRGALKHLPDGPIVAEKVSNRLTHSAQAVSIVEGWRGEIVYFVTTDDSGAISRVAVRDPSFINWQAISYSGAGQMVPDFPLINKSYNQSYSGNDV